MTARATDARLMQAELDGRNATKLKDLTSAPGKLAVDGSTVYYSLPDAGEVLRRSRATRARLHAGALRRSTRTTRRRAATARSSATSPGSRAGSPSMAASCTTLTRRSRRSSTARRVARGRRSAPTTRDARWPPSLQKNGATFAKYKDSVKDLVTVSAYRARQRKCAPTRGQAPSVSSCRDVVCVRLEQRRLRALLHASAHRAHVRVRDRLRGGRRERLPHAQQLRRHRHRAPHQGPRVSVTRAHTLHCHCSHCAASTRAPRRCHHWAAPRSNQSACSSRRRLYFTRTPRATRAASCASTSPTAPSI